MLSSSSCWDPVHGRNSSLNPGRKEEEGTKWMWICWPDCSKTGRIPHHRQCLFTRAPAPTRHSAIVLSCPLPLEDPAEENGELAVGLPLCPGEVSWKLYAGFRFFVGFFFFMFCLVSSAIRFKTHNSRSELNSFYWGKWDTKSFIKVSAHLPYISVRRTKRQLL